MIPLVDFDPDAVYCGTVSSGSIEMAVSIAASYGLIMKGGDLIGAYLITQANENYPVHIRTPQGVLRYPHSRMHLSNSTEKFCPAGGNP